MAPHIETEVLKVHVAVDWRRKRLSVCGSTRVAKRVPGISVSCKVIVDRISEDASSCGKSHSRNQCSPECSFSFHHFGVLHFGLQTRGKEVQVAGLESPNDLGATRRVSNTQVEVKPNNSKTRQFRSRSTQQDTDMLAE